MTEPSHTSIGRTDIVDDASVRFVRHFHPNGVLVEEQRCKILFNGTCVLDGTSSKWNSNGDLIGTFDIVDGTGVQRVWYDNGQLSCENPMVDGLLTGLQRGWDEGGYLLFENFWYRGAHVSKKRYRELQDSDPRIQKYDDMEFRSVAQKRKDRIG